MTTRKQKTVAAMRRQVEDEIHKERASATRLRRSGFYVEIGHHEIAASTLSWVLANVLTTPKPNRKRGGK